jgi:alkyl hydroperoxide reductase subunit AhpC
MPPWGRPFEASREEIQMLKVGQPAPEFKAQACIGGDFKDISLKDYRGKWVVLFFYPLDFTFVCPTELRSFAAHEKAFKEAGAYVLACSTDSAFSHKAWLERDLNEVKYPILADTNHAISRAYDVLIEDKGFAVRGTFIIDPEGMLRSLTVNDTGVGRSVDETLRTLSAFQTGELCPADWKPGQPTLKK